MKKSLINTENKIQTYTITNGVITAQILNYGGIIHSIKVPCNNKKIDVVLGYKDLNRYIDDENYFGAVIGRVANVVKGAKFTLNNQDFSLVKNQNNDSLHGGKYGLTKRFWQVENHTKNSLTLTTFSPDGEDGYPGNLYVKAKYCFTMRGGLSVELFCTCDKETPIALTMHPYFNLNGEGNGTIDNHVLLINSTSVTLTDGDYACTGEFLQVENTPYDFSKPKPIGRDVNSKHAEIVKDGGYDKNYILNDNSVIKAVGDLSGLSLEIFTNQKGVQFYTANSLSVTGGKSGKYLEKYGFCIEPQNYPNAVNIPSFPTPFVKPNEKYYWKTEYLIK